MNPDLSAPLTHEEFVSLRDCAKGLMHRTIPAEHKDRLIQLGYIQELSGGLRLTNANRYLGPGADPHETTGTLRIFPTELRRSVRGALRAISLL
jgi:hypothetical protein